MRHGKLIIPRHPIGFNPRICKRCDTISSYRVIKFYCFNPRICKRCDLGLSMLVYQLQRFNPRICKRCDGSNTSSSSSFEVSIHASVKDATRLTCSLISLISVSIQGSGKDGTGSGVWDLVSYCVSIHASVKDATNIDTDTALKQAFQSTHL